MAKVLVSVDHPVTDEKCCALVQRVADALCVCAEDVVIVPRGLTVSVIEVPADMVKAREKKDAQDKHDAEKKAKEEQHEAEKKAKEEAAAAAAAARAQSHKAKE